MKRAHIFLAGLIIVMVAVAFLSSLESGTVLGNLASASQKSQQDKSVVLHIGNYSNDLDSATTGLILAINLQMHGAKVAIFLDRDGVRLADSRHPPLAFGTFNAGKLFDSFVEAGGRVILCPPSSMLVGVSSKHLKKGAEMGTPDLIAELFLTADIVIDY